MTITLVAHSPTVGGKLEFTGELYRCCTFLNDIPLGRWSSSVVVNLILAIWHVNILLQYEAENGFFLSQKTIVFIYVCVSVMCFIRDSHISYGLSILVLSLSHFLHC